MINSLIRKIIAFADDDSFKEILRGSIYSFSAKTLGKILGLVMSLIVARYYGAEIMGYAAIIGTVLAFAAMIANMGMQTAILRLIPEFQAKQPGQTVFRIYHKILALTVAGSMVTGGILYALSKVIARDVFENQELEFFFMISGAMVCIHAVNMLNSTTIRAFKRIRALAFFDFLPVVIGIILLLVMTFAFYNRFNPVYVSFATVAIMVILTSVYISGLNKEKPVAHPIDRSPSYSHIVTLSLPMFLSNGMGFVMGQADIVMLGMFSSADQIGIYRVAFIFATIPTFALTITNTMAAPKFSELYHQGKIDEFRHVAQKSTRLIFWTSTPVTLTLLVLGHFILSVYGDEFTSGYMALVLLLVGNFTNAIFGPVGYCLSMTGHQVTFGRILLVATLANVVLNYLLIPEFGINGAAFASMASVISWNVMAMLFMKRELGFTLVYFPKDIKSIVRFNG